MEVILAVETRTMMIFHNKTTTQVCTDKITMSGIYICKLLLVRVQAPNILFGDQKSAQ